MTPTPVPSGKSMLVVGDGRPAGPMRCGVPASSDREDALAPRLREKRRRAVLRSVVTTMLMGMALAALMLLDLMFGHDMYRITDVLTALSGGYIPGVSFAIGELRLPRVVIGAFCGMAFGMAGTSFQHLLRNLMASPDIIGITSGANTAAVFGIIILGLSGFPLAALAVAGGLITACSVIWLSSGGGLSYARLILMGIGTGAGLNALSSWILLRANQWDVQAASRWLTGSLASSQWQEVPPLVVTVLVAGSLLVSLRRHVDVLRFGDEIATGLGVRVRLSQTAVLVLSVLLLSVATATSGPISFVSFLAGPLAVPLAGRRAPSLIQAGFMGGCLVIAADIAAQHVPSTQLPVGVVTGIIGGPILAALIIRMTRRQEI
jgi:iron complex transport system permease protein